jgi:hypothetical protein
MTGVSVQIGPRAVGQRCAAWGLAIARDSSLVMSALICAAAGTVVGVAFVVAVMTAQGRFSQPAPAHVPLYFCPAGQRMTGTADGWPVCTGDRP